MSRGPHSFKQTDVVRALRAAEAAGKEVAGFKIDRYGEIVVIFGKAAQIEAASGNEWDDAITDALRSSLP